MQQKTLKYVLLTGVSLIWGIIIYKVIAASNKDTPVTHPKAVTYLNTVLQTDSFTLHADYPDPFIPELPDSTKLKKASPSVAYSQPAQQSQPEKPDLSFIQYNGMINNPSKKTKVGMIILNGQTMIVHEKEEISNILISKVNKNDLVIYWQGKKYNIRRL